MGVAAAAAELVAAISATGLRVAVRDGDITPPVVYIRIGTFGETGIPLTGGTVTVFYVYYIPVRGVDNLAGDAEAIDTLTEALKPLAWAELTGVSSSVTVKNDTWPCYRLDVSLAVIDDAALLKGSD